jgi:hypothetical membrane protein
MTVKSERDKYSEASDIYPKINKFLTYLLSLNILVFILGMLTYGERYQFWEDALSYLGGIKTLAGDPNILSWLIFTFGMILSGILCLYIWFLLNREDEMEHSKFKGYLFLICGIGYFIMIMPHDINNSIHVIGTALVFGMLWLYAVILLIELNHRIEQYKILLFHLFLQGTVLPYAFLYFIDSPIQVQSQKFAVIGLMLVLKLANSQSVTVCQKNAEEYAPDDSLRPME